MRRDTGFPVADAENDFQRQRRGAVLAQLSARLRREPDDVSIVLPYDEVIAALGYESERGVGLKVIDLDRIVGSVDKTRDFDRRFRPTSGRVRQRWERIAVAQRRGQAMPPIDLYQVGELYFVRDGHHRVSVAHALGLDVISAYVTQVRTRLSPTGVQRRGDLLVKSYERIFEARAPLPPQCRAQIEVSNPWSYAELAENIEAWGFRLMQDRGHYLRRDEVALAWYEQEYRPVVGMLHEADLVGGDTEAEAYLRIATERYRLVRQHLWTDDVINKLRDDR